MTVAISIPRRLPLRVIKAGSFGLAGQSVASGVNFLAMVLLARTLGPAAFGLFALLFTVLGLLEAIQSAFFTTPHTVISASKKGADYQRYTSSIALLQGIFALGTGSLLAIAGLVAYRIDTTLSLLLLCLAVATIGVQCQNFIKAVLFTESRFGGALINSGITQGLRLMMIAVLWSGGGLNGERFFLIVGATSLAGTALGLWQVRHSLTRQSMGVDLSLAREHWLFGRWLGAGRVVSEIPQYVTAALLSATLSISAYGAYRAGSQIVKAANVPLSALESLLRPKLARDALRGPAAVWNTTRPIILLGALVLASFAVVVIMLRTPLLRVIFGDEFAPYGAVMFLLALQPLARLLKDVLSNAFISISRTRVIFTRSVVGTVSGSILGSLAIFLFGLPAAGAVSIAGSVVSIIWLSIAWRSHLREASAAPGT